MCKTIKCWRKVNSSLPPNLETDGLPGVTEHVSGQSEKLSSPYQLRIRTRVACVVGRRLIPQLRLYSSTTKLYCLLLGLVVMRTQPWLLTVAPTTEFHENKLWKRHALYRNATRLRDSPCSKVVDMRIGNIVVLLSNKIMYRNFLILDLQNHS